MCSSDLLIGGASEFAAVVHGKYSFIFRDAGAALHVVIDVAGRRRGDTLLLADHNGFGHVVGGKGNLLHLVDARLRLAQGDKTKQTAMYTRMNTKIANPMFPALRS